MALDNNTQQDYKYTEKSTLKNWFKSKLKPTQAQFWAWMDSYWHKGEKLPISTIDGLGEAVDGKAPIVHYHDQYATNDANSLSKENIEQWKKKLDVDNLQFDDQAISLTNEYVDFGLTNDSKQAQFNQSIYNANQSKLNKPSYEGTTEEYPYLVGIDAEGYSANISIDQVGKVKTVNNQEPDENGNIKIDTELLKKPYGYVLKGKEESTGKYFDLTGKTWSLGESTFDFSITNKTDKEYGSDGNLTQVLIGTNLIAKGAGSVVLGYNNTSGTQGSVVLGMNNSVTRTVASGNNNSSILSGQMNTIVDSNLSTIIGDWNTISNLDRTFVAGTNNDIQVNITGNQDNTNLGILKPYSNFITGQNNKISLNENPGKLVYPAFSQIGGSSNVISGRYQFVHGYKNEAVSVNEVLFGTRATIQDKTRFDGNTLDFESRIFGIGVGYGESNGVDIRRDGFNVYRNGLVTLPTVTNSLIEANTKALTTKEFVDNKISNFTLPTNWSNASHTFNALPNKSKVATASEFIVRDSVTKELGYADGTIPFKSLPDNLTDFEKTEWKTKMNGGWTTATMNVGLITPPIVDKKDQNYWITLLGVNLNLNPTSYKVWLVSVDNDVEYEVGLNNNGGVQLFTNGTSLVFYYNFKNLPLGKYKVKLFNGVAYYTTGDLYTVNVVDSMIIKDLSSLNWKTKVMNDASTSSVALGNSVLFKHPESIPKADDNNYVLAFLSDVITNVDENFSIDIVFERAYTNRNTTSWVFVGLVDGSIANPALLNQTLCYGALRGNNSKAYIEAYANNQNNVFANSGTYVYNYSIKMTMIRQGNQLTVVYIGSNGTTFSSTTIPTSSLKIGLYIQNCGESNHTGGITLSNFYTF
ncbi:hypothetical protein [Empedobacter tilapiae]